MNFRVTQIYAQKYIFTKCEVSKLCKTGDVLRVLLSDLLVTVISSQTDTMRFRSGHDFWIACLYLVLHMPYTAFALGFRQASTLSLI